MANLQVSFKAPYEVIEAVRAVILETHNQCAQHSGEKEWAKLTEEQRIAINVIHHKVEMAARFFEVSLPTYDNKQAPLIP